MLEKATNIIAIKLIFKDVIATSSISLNLFLFWKIKKTIINKKIVVVRFLLKGKKKFKKNEMKPMYIKPNNPHSTEFCWIWIFDILFKWCPELIKKIDDKNKFKKRKTIVLIIIISVYYIYMNLLSKILMKNELI